MNEGEHTKTDSQIKFKTTKSNLSSYSDAYVLVKVNITFSNTGAVDADEKNVNKRVIFKNCPTFTK